jgi:chromosome segregation ATPase
VDPAHPLGGCAPAAPAPELATKVPEVAANVIQQGSAVDQLQTQIGQLASRLRERQGELDHRESHLNARVAEVDQDLRTTRLWIEEQEALWAKRQEELTAKEQAIEERLERLAAADAAVLSKHQVLAEAEENLAQREAAIELRAQLIADQMTQHEKNLKEFENERKQVEESIAQQQAELEKSWQVRQHTGEEGVIEELQHAEDAIQKRWQEIELAEARLAAGEEEIKSLRDAMTKQQQEQEEAVRADRLQLALERRRLMAEIEQKREAIERRSEHVDQCQISLTKTRAEVAQIHQETLEARLATEELWAQMAGDAPSAALVERLARLREKLADHYRATQEEIDQKKKELMEIRTELSQEHRRLVKRKHHVDQWADRRQKENHEMAKRLMAREKELNRCEARMADEIHGWEIERIEYQQAIRRLTARVGVAEAEENVAVA